MELYDFIEKQKTFDGKHSNQDQTWAVKITDNNIQVLEHLLVCTLGELGETANIVKKIYRGDFCLDEQRDNLEAEIIDVFIYVLKLIYQLDIDVEKKYTEKMKVNDERFKIYEK